VEVEETGTLRPLRAILGVFIIIGISWIASYITASSQRVGFNET
jgi:hypothetical protein